MGRKRKRGASAGSWSKEEGGSHSTSEATATTASATSTTAITVHAASAAAARCVWIERTVVAPALPRPSRASWKRKPPPGVTPKYWRKRDLLWSRFEQGGICMDAEGWYSVTPECIAVHVADTLARAVRFGVRTVAEASPPPPSSGSGYDSRSLVVADLFGGCGGNAIQLALHPRVSHVFAVELHAERLAMAQRNAAVYGVPPGRITWILGDAVEFLLRALQASGGGEAAPLFPFPVGAAGASLSRSGEIASPLTMLQLEFRRDPAHLRRAIQLRSSGGGSDAGSGGGVWHTLDAIHCAPPWGGVSYSASPQFSLRTDMPIASPHAAPLRALLWGVTASGGVGVSAASTSSAASVDTAEAAVASAPVAGSAAAEGCGGVDSHGDAAVLSGMDLLRAVAAAAPLSCHYLPRHTALGELRECCDGIVVAVARGPSRGGPPEQAGKQEVAQQFAEDLRDPVVVMADRHFVEAAAGKATALCVYVQSG